MGACPTFPALSLPPGAREDTPLDSAGCFVSFSAAAFCTVPGFREASWDSQVLVWLLQDFLLPQLFLFFFLTYML